MKHLLIVLLMCLSVGTINAKRAPHHSNHQKAVATRIDTISHQVTAVSDTSSTVSPSDTLIVDQSNANGFDNDDDDALEVNNKFNQTMEWFTTGVFGSILAVFVVFFILSVLLFPFILLIWFVRNRIKKHNSKVDDMQKAIEEGKLDVETLKAQRTYVAEKEWRSGILQIATGIGLVFLFAFMGIRSLIGVGLLVACLGAGSLYIAKKKYSNNPFDKDDNNRTEF